MEQRLEETSEELQRVTEAESFLKSRCSSLEEEQRKNKEQIKVVNNQFYTPAHWKAASFGKLKIKSFFPVSFRNKKLPSCRFF